MHRRFFCSRTTVSRAAPANTGMEGGIAMAGDVALDALAALVQVSALASVWE
jgi:hypothetical protein